MFGPTGRHAIRVQQQRRRQLARREGTAGPLPHQQFQESDDGGHHAVLRGREGAAGSQDQRAEVGIAGAAERMAEHQGGTGLVEGIHFHPGPAARQQLFQYRLQGGKFDGGGRVRGPAPGLVVPAPLPPAAPPPAPLRRLRRGRGPGRPHPRAGPTPGPAAPAPPGVRVPAWPKGPHASVACWCPPVAGTPGRCPTPAAGRIPARSRQTEPSWELPPGSGCDAGTRQPRRRARHQSTVPVRSPGHPHRLRPAAPHRRPPSLPRRRRQGRAARR